MRLFLSLLLCVGFANTAFAADELPNLPEENKASDDQSYEIRRALRLVIKDRDFACDYGSVGEFLVNNGRSPLGYASDTPIYVFEGEQPVLVSYGPVYEGYTASTSKFIEVRYTTNADLTVVTKIEYFQYKVNSRTVNKGTLVRPDIVQEKSVEIKAQADCRKI